MSLAVLADHMASKGRGPDSMLIHMSPKEVAGLQSLAMAHGGSLTVNPDTGLPEAGFLDKLLPTIIGAGLSMIPGVGPMMAAGIVGGIQTVRTGDIGKGLAAGLGAYGGAGLAQGLSSAGASALGGEAALGAGIPADIAANLTDAGVSTANADLASQAIQQAQPTAFDKVSAGFKAATASPEAAGAFLKDNAKNLMYAAGPAIMAGANVQAKGPQTVTKPGMITPYSFDPYSGSYVAANPYEAAPTRAAEGGLMGMADGGFNPGQLDFAQRSEPVIRMAAGTPPKMFSDEELFKQTGSWEEAARLRDEQNNALNQYNWAQQAAAPVAAPAAAPIDYNQVATEYVKSAATPSTTTEQFITGAEKAGVGLTAPLASALQNSGLSAAAQYALTHADIGSPLNKEETYGGLAGLSSNINYALSQNKLTGAAGMRAALDEMDKYGINEDDIFRATGKKLTELFPQEIKTVTRVIGTQGGAGGTDLTPTRVTETVLPTDPTVNAPPGTRNPYGGPNTPGDVTFNPDGSKTITPNIPGRPYGGFSGIKEVRDAYTAGGGSLGYVPYAPKTIEEFESKYNKLTGGSKQAYDYLTGKTPYSPVPSTPTGEIQKPYWESVGGMPVNTSKRMYLFDPATKQYKVNPDYAIPTYDSKGKRTYALTNKDVSAYVAGNPSSADFYNWVRTNNLTVEQIAAATGMPITEVQKMLSSGTPKEEIASGSSTVQNGDNGGDANGGLMKLAQGGITGDGNLNLHIPLDIGGGGGFGGFGGGTPIASGLGGASSTFTGQNNTAGGGYGEVYRPDESGGLYKEPPPGLLAGLDDSGMGSPEILARSRANDAARASAGTNPASLASLAKALGSGGMFAAGGATGGNYNLGDYSDGGRLLRGPGDGVSDSIPASIGNKRPARLADGEFVVPARIVSELGNGSTEAGARKLYAMMDRVQAARRGTVGKGKVAKNSRSDKHLPA